MLIPDENLCRLNPSSVRHIETFLYDRDEHVNGDGKPDLAIDGVLGGDEKRLMRRCCLIGVFEADAAQPVGLTLVVAR